MLDIYKIDHNAAAYTEAWFEARRGKITASKFSLLTGIKGISQQGITYLYNLAGEIVTGERSDDEIFNDDVNWGNAHEPEAILWTTKQLGFNLIRNSGRTHTLIINDEYSGATPDALMVKYEDVSKAFNKDKTKLKCMTLEVKCPRKFHSFIRTFSCDSIWEIRDEKPIWYWQVIFQQMVSGVMDSYFAPYHPLFPCKGHIFRFNRIEVAEDLKLAKSRLDEATEILKETVQKLQKTKITI